jgi:L-threonylcarbamoyladenylate synthase
MSRIEEAAGVIRGGGVVGFPTETVYGLGANALDPIAVARIFELKERPAFDPLIVHVDGMPRLRQLTTSRDPRIDALAEAFWPGPLTLILPKSEGVPDLVTSGLPTVGIRMPDHPMALELITRSDRPIAAPSANKFGRISPTEAWHVRKHLPGVDMILEGGKTRVGIESTIIALREDGFQFLRPGAITREQLREVLPESSVPLQADGPQAPGMLASHYSPVKPFYLFSEELLQSLDPAACGFIGLQGPAPADFGEVRILTRDGDLKTYAAALFGAMHDLENTGVSAIVAAPVPEEGIGIAIMDRLRKAAYRDDKA